LSIARSTAPRSFLTGDATETHRGIEIAVRDPAATARASSSGCHRRSAIRMVAFPSSGEIAAAELIRT